jgi:hypothetical protein
VERRRGSAAVDWRDVLGSSSSSPPCATEVSSSRWPQTAARDKNAGSSSRLAARPAREDQWIVRSRVAPSGMGTPEVQRAPPCQVGPPRRSEEQPAPDRQLFDGSDLPDSHSLQRRRSRARSTDSASTLSAPREEGSGATPRRLQSLLIRGSGAPDVHVSLVTGGGQGSTPATTGVGGSAPEQLGERSTAVEAVSRSGAAPELAAQSTQPPSRARRTAR